MFEALARGLLYGAIEILVEFDESMICGEPQDLSLNLDASLVNQ
jgi:hypothetical protein